MKKLLLIIFCIFFPCCRICKSDILTVGIHDYNGTFIGLESGKVIFETKNDGKKETIEEPASKVVGITLTKPQDATLIKSTSSKSKTVLILGYEKPLIAFQENGRKTKMFFSQVQTITVNGLNVNSENVGSVEFKPELQINIKMLENKQDLTEEEKSALIQYKDAKVQYDSFIESNGKLVQELDSANGDRRSLILNELRSRKYQEAPIKQAYVSARNNLYKIFPELN